MAKPTTKPTEPEAKPEFVPSFKLSFETYTVDDYRTLPPQSVERLINLGFSTALKNSKAGLGVKGLEAWSNEDVTEAYKALPEGTEHTLANLSKHLGDTATSKQFNAILSGTSVARSGGTRGPRAVGIEKYIKEAALRVITKAITDYNNKNPSAKMAAPTKAADIATAVDRLRTKPVWKSIEAAAKADFDRDNAMTADMEDVLG